MTKQTKRNVLLATGGLALGATVPSALVIASSMKSENKSQTRSISSVYSDKEIEKAVSSEVTNYYSSNPGVGKNLVLESEIQDRVKRQVIGLGEVSEAQLRDVINSEVSNVFGSFTTSLDSLLTSKLQEERQQQTDIIFNSYIQTYENLKNRIEKEIQDNKLLINEGKWIADWQKHTAMRPKFERKDILYKEQLTSEIAILNQMASELDRADSIAQWARYDYSEYKTKLDALEYDDVEKKVLELHYDLMNTYAGVILEPEVEKELGELKDVVFPSYPDFLSDYEKQSIAEEAKVWITWAENKIQALRNQKYKDGILQRYPNKVIEDDLIIPSYITRIPYRTFSGFTIKKRLFVPETVKVIGREAFYKTNFQEGVHIGMGLVEIEEAGFAETNLGNDEFAFRLPPTIEKLGTRAFAYTDLPVFFSTYGYLAEPTSNVFEDSLKDKNKRWVEAGGLDDDRFESTSEKVNKETGKPVDIRRWFVIKS